MAQNKRDMEKSISYLQKKGYEPLKNDEGFRKGNHIIKHSDSGKSLTDNFGDSYTSHRDVTGCTRINK